MVINNYYSLWAKGLITIIVNAQETVVTAGQVSYAQVVRLAFPGSREKNLVYDPNYPYLSSNWRFTVVYRRGPENRSGTLIEGGFIGVKREMIFDVTRT